LLKVNVISAGLFVKPRNAETSFPYFDVKIKDHCQFTGNFRGAAHNSCNTNYK
jgi:hypothetical protein